MTTINNLSIEQMREIVDGAPEGAVNWWCFRECYAKDTESFGSADPFIGFQESTSTPIFINNKWELYHSSGFPNLTGLDEIRTAIAKHNEFKVGDSIVAIDESMKRVFVILAIEYGTLYKVAKASFFEFGSFRHATPEEIKAGHLIDKQLESDDCTDIRNHLSPSTKVVDL